jgi:hypothetical protein
MKKGESISIDIAQDPHNLEMFMRYAEEYGGDSAAAHTLMESELARQSLRPNRVFSDGTALPASFGKIRDQHIQEQGKTALTPDIIGQHQSNQDRISRFGKMPPHLESAHRHHHQSERTFMPAAIKFAQTLHHAALTSTPRLRSSRRMTEHSHRRNRCWCNRVNR